MATMKFGFGQPLTRKEDDALLRGAGTYIAEVAPQGALHAVVLRSPHAHARIIAVDAQAAAAISGVEAVYTGADLVADDIGTIPTLAVFMRPDGKPMTVPPRRLLAHEIVRYAGEAVAAVVTVRDRVASLEAAEIVLADGVDLVCHSFDWPAPFARPWPAYLLFEAADDDDPADELAAALAGISGLGDVAVATMADGSARRDALWRYREQHTLALRGLGPTVKLDVTVPLHTIGGHAFISNCLRSGAAPLCPFVFTARFGVHSWGKALKKFSR